MIREITKSDFELFWPEFSEIIKSQETYAFDQMMNLEESYDLWCKLPLKTYGFFEKNLILGTYYIKQNAMGPGNHICNCGYMVSKKSRGKGIARKMCEHSQIIALELGFEAMQFNCVVSTNEAAINLWKKLGFKIVGRIPKGYRHSRFGYVDSLVMYKSL
ncbi:GNAT family N-acetyltransferase [Alkalispirochaeta sphaeroplastigenens]|uniref:GNAT family N-acetyltransferase n=1 Tax=Alkalispirochaeta sphaeroplastigenens TaxID=1187066 RepID=UPI000CDAC03C|nr:GNAT family protein [Alkalispirochaeta sphaeroplastigenens]